MAEQPAPRYEYLSALRGWAILGVIVVHVSQAVPDLPYVVRLMADQGARGVQLFFVVSAFTLMLSWHRRNDGALAFYIRRLLRIAPMFWLAIVGFVALYGFGPRYWAPDGIDWRHILATATFVHGLHPTSITSVVPGGWTIADEMTFYFIFPALALVCRRWWQAAILFAASIVIFRYATSEVFVWPGYEPEYLGNNYRALWFFAQFPIFMVGIVAFFIYGMAPNWSFRVAGWVASLAVIAALVIPFTQEIFAFSLVQSRWGHLAYGLVFGVLLLALSTGWKGYLVSPALCWIGDRSFSAYLWHFAFLTILSQVGAFGLIPHIWPPLVRFAGYLAMVGTSTFVFSAVTFKLVEQPMIDLGSRMARSIATRQPTVRKTA